MTLHILNFCTTLTPATALARHHKHGLRTNADAPPTPRVDFTSPAIASVLSTLADAETASGSSSDASVYVKIGPPLYVRVIPAPSPAHPATSASSILSSAMGKSTDAVNSGDVIENFMSGWTMFVGDPVMSKWIVVLLGISVALNGFLLKGIAAGTGLPLPRGSVRFRSKAQLSISEKLDEEDHKPALIMPSVIVPAPPVAEPAVAPPAPVKEHRPPVLSIPVDLSTVDAKLEKERLHAEALARIERTRNEPTRTLDEIVDIFENGPRPVSASLSLLTDEEVIILAQAGKIAAYALEKMLGDFERAVTVRRALICTSSVPLDSTLF